MLKIKLVRIGKKGQPAFRLVVARARGKIDGRHLDYLGFYNPLTSPSTLKIDKDKYLSWIARGAQPTQKVQLLAKKVL